MLAKFVVANYLSFKDPVTLNMVPTSIKEFRDTHVFKVRNIELLKSAIVYGPNASGKSNLIAAMARMRYLVLNSSKESQASEPLDIEPFRLSTECEDMPSFFEVTFFKDDIQYRYGFTADKSEFKEEWLYWVKNVKEVPLFQRNGDDYYVSSSFKEGKGLEEKTRKNALFLSVVSNFNGKISISIIEWFSRFNIISGLQTNYLPISIEQIQRPEGKMGILNLLKAADLGIEDISSQESPIEVDDIPIQIQRHINSNTVVIRTRVYTHRKKFGIDGAVVSLEAFDLDKFESEGTKKVFALSGPLLDTLQNGKVLVIDELDAKLHPTITNFLVNLFNSERNVSNAQLIFNTHDVNLLDQDIRRDQIWFTDKNRFGVTQLYSLVDYQLNDKKVRNDASYRKDYMLGKYGAVPTTRMWRLENSNQYGEDVAKKTAPEQRVNKRDTQTD